MSFKHWHKLFCTRFLADRIKRGNIIAFMNLADLREDIDKQYNVISVNYRHGIKLWTEGSLNLHGGGKVRLELGLILEYKLPLWTFLMK